MISRKRLRETAIPMPKTTSFVENRRCQLVLIFLAGERVYKNYNSFEPSSIAALEIIVYAVQILDAVMTKAFLDPQPCPTSGMAVPSDREIASVCYMLAFQMISDIEIYGKDFLDILSNRFVQFQFGGLSRVQRWILKTLGYALPSFSFLERAGSGELKEGDSVREILGWAECVIIHGMTIGIPPKRDEEIIKGFLNSYPEYKVFMKYIKRFVYWEKFGWNLSTQA